MYCKMILEVKDLHKSFGEKKVLEGVDLSVSSGKALGLLGRNGAGKTTTIRIVMGVFPSDSGQVLLDKNSLDRNSVPIGYMPEEHGLYPKIEILEQLVYLGELRGMKARDARESVNKWMKRLEVEEYTKKRLDTLSKGNQQKIQLVATLITTPDIVILDEPFSGLDPVNASLLKDVVRELIGDGKIVLFSSHQMSYVEEFCDDIAILNDGKIVLAGGINDIKRSYDRKIVCVRSGKMKDIANFCQSGLQDIVEKSEFEKDYIKITLKSAEQKLKLMGALAEKGFDIDSFGVYEPSLSDIFVEYTGDASQKEGGAA